MEWFTYRQNNSGGVFYEDMPMDLHIEAKTSEQADLLAQALGVYFDGCASGVDCYCCGDRWHTAYSGEEERPEVYHCSWFSSRTAGVWYLPFKGELEKHPYQKEG